MTGLCLLHASFRLHLAARPCASLSLHLHLVGGEDLHLPAARHTKQKRPGEEGHRDAFSLGIEGTLSARSRRCVHPRQTRSSRLRLAGATTFFVPSDAGSPSSSYQG